ncbi:MAG: cytochrome c oxidase subunit II [Pseudomonadaceae bacterium]|nr:MAG: cytochrome c oxidase subunit II [Pseudomonadaceae bacterium]
MAPAANQTAYAAHNEQVQHADDAGHSPAQGANTGQPQAGARPEFVCGHEKGQVAGNQADQCRHREVHQSRVQGVTTNGHAAGDRRSGHRASRLHTWVAGAGHVRRILSARVTACTLLTSPLWLTGCSGPLSTLDPAGPAAASAAALWWSMFVVASVVLLVLCGLWWYAMRRSPPALSPTRQAQLERRWIIGGGLVLPMTCIGILLLFGIPAGQRMLPLPVPGQEPLVIEVTGHMWWWQIEYPEQGIELQNVLHIPVDQPVDIHLRSADVIHSFWVPRLAGKLDAIPGRTNVLRLQASQTGEFYGQCAEFCGVGHSHMQFRVIAHEGDSFQDWLEEQGSDE